MSNTHKSFARLLALLLAVCLLTAALAGCEDDPSQTESTSGGEADIALQIGDATLAVTAYNTTPASDAAALLDRGYQRDGAYVYFADAAEGRVLVAVKSTLSGDTRTFAVQEILRAGEGESLYIPVNGFVLSLPEGMLPEGIKNGQTVTAEGYQPSAYERTEICAVLNEDRAYPRRVNLIDPVEAPDSGAGIIYITGRYKNEQTVPADSVALLLNSASGGSFTVGGVLEAGSELASKSAYLLFCGAYNAGFAKAIYKEGDKLYMTRTENLSRYADDAAVRIGGKVYAVGDAHVNPSEITEDGAYLFDASGSLMATPALSGKSHRSYVLSDSKVLYAAEAEESIIIPSDAAVLTLVKPGLLDDISRLHQLIQRPLYGGHPIAALGGYGLDRGEALALFVAMQNQDLQHKPRSGFQFRRKCPLHILKLCHIPILPIMSYCYRRFSPAIYFSTSGR